jgi:hypothetical protein
MCTYSCSKTESVEYDGDIKIKYYHGLINFHELGRTKRALYYKNKKLCSDFGSYKFFPDRKMILLTNEVKYGISKFELYDIVRNRKLTFKYKFRSHNIPLIKNVNWIDNNQIRIKDFCSYGMNTILYINEMSIEFVNNKRKDYYFDYLLIQIDQLYNNVDSSSKKEMKKFIEPYLGVRLIYNILPYSKQISTESWKKMSNRYYGVIKELKPKYEVNLVFKIFERAFYQYHRIENGMVLFLWSQKRE